MYDPVAVTLLRVLACDLPLPVEPLAPVFNVAAVHVAPVTVVVLVVVVTLGINVLASIVRAPLTQISAVVFAVVPSP